MSSSEQRENAGSKHTGRELPAPCASSRVTSPLTGHRRLSAGHLPCGAPLSFFFVWDRPTDRDRPSVPPSYRFTWGRGRRTLAQDSGRTKTIETESRMAVLFSSTRGVSCRGDFFSRYFLKKFHSHQLSLEKVHTRSQTVTRCGDEAPCGFRRGLNSSDQAELAYPP